MKLTKSGRIYGEGYKGIVRDVAYIKGDKKTLYNALNKIDKNKVKIYGIKDNKIHIYSIERVKLLKIIEKKEDFITKEFKNNLWFLGYVKKTFFDNELNGIIKLMKIFKNDIQKFTSIVPLFKYNGCGIYGLTYGDNYYVFSKKCGKTIDNIKFTTELYKKFITDIYYTLKLFKENDYLHNDLKPDNIILCNNKFKIIDWELSKKVIYNRASYTVNFGNPLFNHPLKIYIKGLPYVVYKQYFNEYMENENSDYIRYKSLNYFKDHLMNGLNNIVNIKKMSRFNAYKKYAKYFDLYSFAMIIAYIGEINKLKIPYKFINKLIKNIE